MDTWPNVYFVPVFFFRNKYPKWQAARYTICGAHLIRVAVTHCGGIIVKKPLFVDYAQWEYTLDYVKEVITLQLVTLCAVFILYVSKSYVIYYDLNCLEVLYGTREITSQAFSFFYLGFLIVFCVFFFFCKIFQKFFISEIGALKKIFLEYERNYTSLRPEFRCQSDQTSVP